jgi:hypothetical protein
MAHSYLRIEAELPRLIEALTLTGETSLNGERQQVADVSARIR